MTAPPTIIRAGVEAAGLGGGREGKIGRHVFTVEPGHDIVHAAEDLHQPLEAITGPPDWVIIPGLVSLDGALDEGPGRRAQALAAAGYEEAIGREKDVLQLLFAEVFRQNDPGRTFLRNPLLVRGEVRRRYLRVDADDRLARRGFASLSGGGGGEGGRSS